MQSLKKYSLASTIMKKIWDKGELLAIEYLERNEYEIIETNYKYSIFWEIDIIAKKEDLWVFVEVKFRQSDTYWAPIESITRSKKMKLKKTIFSYLYSHRIGEEFARFDVISIERGKTSFHLTHYRNQSLQ